MLAAHPQGAKCLPEVPSEEGFQGRHAPSDHSIQQYTLQDVGEHRKAMLIGAMEDTYVSLKNPGAKKDSSAQAFLACLTVTSPFLLQWGWLGCSVHTVRATSTHVPSPHCLGMLSPL